VTGVQSQVTSGNKRSCGCLQDEIRRQKRPTISRAETEAARKWARKTGAVIGGNGRLPDRVVASYRLFLTGNGHLLGEDGYLGEEPVRGWAQTNNRPLAARGRLPSALWLDFVDDYLKPERAPQETFD
jgi:hypothetical protein